MGEKRYSLATINKKIRPMGLTLVEDPTGSGFTFLGHYTDKLPSHKNYVPVDLVTELPEENWIREAKKVHTYIQEIKNAERKQFNS